MQIIIYFLIMATSILYVVMGLKGKTETSPKKLISRLGLFTSVTVIIALMSGDSFSRLSTLAFKPRALFDYPVPEITATLSPPLYLNQETSHKIIKISNAEDADINPIYEGSILDVHVKGLKWQPTVRLSDGKEVPFEVTEEGSFKASVKIDQQISWSLNQGSHVIGSWPIILIDDEKPVISSFTLEDHENEKGYIALKIALKDDRKIMKTSIEVGNESRGSMNFQDLSIRDVSSYNNIFYLDFTGSQYAGLKADLKILVEDEAGQVSTAELKDIELPEKTYSQPIAHKLISLRNELSEPDYDLRALSRQMKALGLLSDQEGLPPIYYMALRSAYWRLVDPSQTTDRQVARDLLWDIAQKIEDSELGPIENELIISLDELTLSINQKKTLGEIRDKLRVSNDLFRNYINASRTNVSGRYTLDVDMAALRKLYSYILAFSDQDKYRNAVMIVDFMKKGLVQNDELILSKGGLGNYFALSESRQIIDNLITIQKTLLASSYNEQMQGKLVESSIVRPKNNKKPKDKNKQILLQSKVGDAVKLLGEKISFAGDNSGFLIQNASELVNDIIANMKRSETHLVTQSQSELIAVMSNLKRVLNKPISSSFELQNILKEISSKPVS
ncbi:MAG: DUF4175 family protein [Kordiimonadaceae bacterium]|jgi:hypothetical protein|nr:DUF4175 family protein [Kordiimonadaceae bacterium]MBT6037242.1 DUF4175 family protein [Kordiimonadaceae bacterium]MBT6329001.1 DUF4175 family protein [Kordiimonadaceae bacterium]MBT7581675.1 DUF4175 family protein [Kordiimonadaceae bacterium]